MNPNEGFSSSAPIQETLLVQHPDGLSGAAQLFEINHNPERKAGHLHPWIETIQATITRNALNRP
ncbi:hypothetical protein [Thiolapillus sp.]